MGLVVLIIFRTLVLVNLPDVAIGEENEIRSSSEMDRDTADVYGKDNLDEAMKGSCLKS